MNRKFGRALPLALMILGAALALFALAMLSLQGGALQYCAAAPQNSDNGQAIVKLAEAGGRLGAEMKDALSWTSVSAFSPAASVSAGGREEVADVCAIGEGWMEVYPRFLIRGRLITGRELSGGDRVILLDEGLAFRLFGDTLPEDATVKINEISWRVVGTVRHGGSLLGGRGVGDLSDWDVYVPLIAAAKAGLSFETIELSAVPKGGAGAAQLFEEAARSQWLADGQLINLDKEAMRKTILPRLVLLVAGLDDDRCVRGLVCRLPPGAGRPVLYPADPEAHGHTRHGACGLRRADRPYLAADGVLRPAAVRVHRMGAGEHLPVVQHLPGVLESDPPGRGPHPPGHPRAARDRVLGRRAPLGHDLAPAWRGAEGMGKE